MQIASKTNGDTLSASEFNQITTELQTNLITKSGQTPASGTLDQVGIAVASIAAQGGVFATDSGAADAYVLTQISPFPAPYALKDGLTIRFRAGNANTGASTVTPFGFSPVSIKQADGSSALTAGMISTTSDTLIRYDGTNFRLSGATQAASTTVAGIVELLTNAELQTGTDTTRAATAASILSLFSASSRAASGYMRLPINISGAFVEAIIQWGSSSITTSGAGSVTGTAVSFPLTFPNAVYSINATSSNENNVGLIDNILTVKSLTTGGFNVNVFNGDTGVSSTVYWMAIGY